MPVPFTDLAGDKRRPALVVSRENHRCADPVVCFTTSVPRVGPDMAPIAPSPGTGLKVPSATSPPDGSTRGAPSSSACLVSACRSCLFGVGLGVCLGKESTTVPFSDEERAALLATKGVGPKVVERLESLGISGFGELAGRDPAAVCAAVAAALGSTCWSNSPQARAAVAAAVAVARGRPGG